MYVEKLPALRIVQIPISLPEKKKNWLWIAWIKRNSVIFKGFLSFFA